MPYVDPIARDAVNSVLEVLEQLLVGQERHRTVSRLGPVTVSFAIQDDALVANVFSLETQSICATFKIRARA